MERRGAMLLAVGVSYAQLVTPETIERATKAVVLIQGTTETGARISGSGFLISPDGRIVTNLHVIRDLKTGGVQLQSGEVFDTVSVVAFDERKDVAILRIAGFDVPTLALG